MHSPPGRHAPACKAPPLSLRRKPAAPAGATNSPATLGAPLGGGGFGIQVGPSIRLRLLVSDAWRAGQPERRQKIRTDCIDRIQNKQKPGNEHNQEAMHAQSSPGLNTPWASGALYPTSGEWATILPEPRDPEIYANARASKQASKQEHALENPTRRALTRLYAESDWEEGPLT